MDKSVTMFIDSENQRDIENKIDSHDNVDITRNFYISKSQRGLRIFSSKNMAENKVHLDHSSNLDLFNEPYFCGSFAQINKSVDKLFFKQIQSKDSITKIINIMMSSFLQNHIIPVLNKKGIDKKELINMIMVRYFLKDELYKYSTNINRFAGWNILTNIFDSSIAPLNKDTQEDCLSSLHDSDLLESLLYRDILDKMRTLIGYIVDIKRDDKQITPFDSCRVPNIAVRDYFSRLVEFFLCSPSMYILSFIYIDRLIKKNPTFSVDVINAHRLLVTTLLLAVKLFDDKLLSNSYYSKVGGISNLELNKMEAMVFTLLDFDLNVSFGEFVFYALSIKLVGGVLQLIDSK
ncbi:cyclin, N-terminal domain-containing protein [Cryptosporidium muris RN66]|uniref:Cyclin, N-terminal domain-containing protein n=1 Tax=Cryptosporidium muris (strain RN66) TaxID=441375 RepID=B6AH52_CRYMR|nr:cyclin, N-terminal domain-containing protein [Cryptosporidium muris RN66]EEA07543.1 cyclin, N-terminal domain-containing protein [Cryptosporidium muris RN66]|eukprot:XP_002141892.1 cyclin, N-terminal domain-containing protein [Cryptosporidium muris RN66]